MERIEVDARTGAVRRFTQVAYTDGTATVVLDEGTPAPEGFVPGVGPTPAATRQEVEHLRLLAYADPITGSDRFISEAAHSENSAELLARAAARRLEIQLQYPWPDME